MQNIVHAETGVLITFFRFSLEKRLFLCQIVSIVVINKVRQPITVLFKNDICGINQ